MEVDTVIFDLDGTLADTLADIADAMNHVLRERDLPTHGRDAYRYFVGEGVRRLVEHAVPPDATARVDELVLAFRDRYYAHLLDETRAYRGVPELLRELAHRGVTTAVLSNKPHEATVAIARALFPHHRFAVVRGHQADAPRKPDPATALAIAQDVGTRPDRCAFVGDTAIDMETAKEAGMIPIGVLWGFRDAEELRENGARELLARPADLLKLV